MKHRISVTLEEQVLVGMKEAIRLSRSYESQSHFVETAIKEKLVNKNEHNE